MADDQALGNALMVFGQTGGNAVNQYFGNQIKAAENAQASTLKMLQMKQQSDQKQAELSESSRAHDLEHQDRQAGLQSEDSYRKAETETAKQRAEQEGQYQQGELKIRGGELDNQKQNTASEIAHRGAEEEIERERLANEKGKGQGAADEAGAKDLESQLSQAREQLKKVNPNGVADNLLTGDALQQSKAINSRISDLTTRLNSAKANLSREGKLNAPVGGSDQLPGTDEGMADVATGVAPASNPQASSKSAPKVNTASIPSPAINLLKSNPSTSIRAQFDQKYGQGASAQILGE